MLTYLHELFRSRLLSIAVMISVLFVTIVGSSDINEVLENGTPPTDSFVEKSIAQCKAIEDRKFTSKISGKFLLRLEIYCNDLESRNPYVMGLDQPKFDSLRITTRRTTSRTVATTRRTTTTTRRVPPLNSTTPSNQTTTLSYPPSTTFYPPIYVPPTTNSAYRTFSVFPSLVLILFTVFLTR